MLTIFSETISIASFMVGFNQSPYWDNPSKKGTSEIVKINDAYIWYKRGKTCMRISIDLINKIYDYIIKNNLIGKKIFTKDLVDIKNNVSPKYTGWHNCDSTFIMMLARYVLGLPVSNKRPYFIIF